jgi:predicted enzyme involved in methoxymalonyl-ACP biosynthesis
MSCRVIGRNIEVSFLETVLGYVIADGARSIYAEYRPTQKNAQVEDFYDRMGFDLIGLSDGNRKYQLNASSFTPRQLDYISVKTDFSNINIRIHE